MQRAHGVGHFRWPVALAAALLVPPDLGRADLPGIRTDLYRVQGELAGLRDLQPVQQEGEAGRLARFEIRLQQLDEQMRRLTGHVEELEFERRRLEERVAELEAQLAAGSPGDPSAAAAAEGGADPVPRPAVAATPDGASSDGRGTMTPGPPAADQTLGTIPESALANLPSPETSPPPEPAPGAAAGSPQAQYDAAMDLLRAGDYAGAERGLEQFLGAYPEHPLSANAAYWLAETHYVRKNYAAAAAAFARNYRTYGKSTAKSADNLLKLGMSLQGLGETDKACLSYQELAQEFPNAPAHIQQALARERGRAECV